MKSNDRIETDSLGDVRVPADRYWGAQTQRALVNFKIGQQTFPRSMIRAFGIVKKAVAIVNEREGKLDSSLKGLIVKASDEVIAGSLDEHFPLPIWQSGSGTQSNMNANEVISNRAIELAGGEMGRKQPVHPNDHVNMSQSSNDFFPTCMHIAAVDQIENLLLPSVIALRDELSSKSEQFKNIIKVGRTHLMDATPITFGQEISAYVSQLDGAIKSVEQSLEPLRDIALGGSSVGTGLNTGENYSEFVAEEISTIAGTTFSSAQNKFSLLSSHDVFVSAHSALKQTAVACMKIANDIRLLASGPRCGIGEINLPANEPGSSIMPGKVNPTQCEAMAMVCAQVIGNDVAVSVGGAGGYLELNVYKPLIIKNYLESLELVSHACRSFSENCVAGMEVNEKVVSEYLNNSLMLVTALNEKIGYDKAAKISGLAFKDGLTLKEAALKLKLISEIEFDELVKPENMV